MKRVQMPISEPLIKGFLFFAYPLSILGNNEKTYPWILNNFIQTCFEKDFTTSPVPFTFYSYDFTICPWLKYEKILRNTLDYLSSDVLHFVKSCINNNKYIHLYLDEFNVPNRKAYKEFNLTHENLVFGYDDATATFDILGFNERMIFKASKISYENFLKSYIDVDKLIKSRDFHQELHPDSIDIFSTINIFEYNNNAQYSFNCRLVIDTLKDYLYGNNTSNWFAMLREPWDRAYGIKSYEYILKYYELFLKEDVDFDIRYLHNLWEHKMLMSKRVIYMQENGFVNLPKDVIQGFKKIENEVFILRNAMIKYSITGNKNILKPILSILPRISEDEFILINQLIISAETMMKHDDNE